LLIAPPVSLDAVHVKLTCVLDAAVAVRFVGAVGVAASVLAEAVAEYGPRSFAESVARTR